MKKMDSKFKSLGRRAFYVICALGILAAVTVGVCSCKAWRTITTTASYVQSADSTGAKATITTKTVEEYQGVKKR